MSSPRAGAAGGFRGHAVRPRAEESAGLHATYLAIIAVLVLVVAYAVAEAARLRRRAEAAARDLGALGRAAFPRRAPLREATPAELLAPRTYGERRAEVDALVARALALGEFGAEPSALAEACARALRGGKRLRPIIVLEVARAAALAGGGPPADAADAALAVEFIHAASLVVDDLPAFDDDATRRGAPAVHVTAGPAVAQMAALSLVAAAFQDLARQADWIRDNCPGFEGGADRVGTRLCHDVARAIGARGAAGGQFMDSALSGAELFALHGEGGVREIARRKTAALFEASFAAGWLVGGGAPGGAAGVRRAGRRFGEAFQAADDLGDMAQDAARAAAGKPGWNLANVYGPAEAEREVARGLDACRRGLEDEKLFTPLWREVFAKVWDMAER